MLARAVADEGIPEEGEILPVCGLLSLLVQSFQAPGALIAVSHKICSTASTPPAPLLAVK